MRKKGAAHAVHSDEATCENAVASASRGVPVKVGGGSTRLLKPPPPPGSVVGGSHSATTKQQQQQVETDDGAAAVITGRMVDVSIESAQISALTATTTAGDEEWGDFI